MLLGGGGWVITMSGAVKREFPSVDCCGFSSRAGAVDVPGRVSSSSHFQLRGARAEPGAAAREARAHGGAAARGNCRVLSNLWLFFVPV